MTTTYDPTIDESLDSLTQLGGNQGPRHYFGEITIVDDFDCILERGRGKVPFDPSFHRPEQRLVALKLKVTCQKADGSTYDLDQDDITSGSKHKVTLESLKPLGITGRAQLRTLAGKHCQAVRVETGRTYIATKGTNAGQQVAETALKFVALYDSADACKAAEREFYTPKGDGRNQPQPITAADTGSAPTIAREQLLATLPAIWQASGKNPAMLGTILAGNPAYAQAGITLTAPEVVALTGQAA